MEPIYVVLIVIAGTIVFFTSLYAFLIGTGKKRKKETLEFASFRYAHRGLHDDVSPENSLSAFKKAVENGYAIELDVRLSSDGVLVVFHDDTLDRMTSEAGKVNLRTADELSKINLLNTGEGIPTFDEVLSIVDGRVPLLVEIKEEKGSLAVTEKTCERLKSYTGPYVIESFNPLALKRVREIMPNAIIGILCEHFTKNEVFKKPLFYVVQSMALNFTFRPDFVAYAYTDTSFLPFRLVRLMGAVTFAYTLKSEKDEIKSLKSDFNTVIFERYTPKSPRITENTK